ncbi:MAG: 16S rRNA methyltransferase [Anaerolineae bacterium]
MADVDKIVEAVRQTAKYATVTPELIAHLAEEELRKRPNLKEATKATKNRLHQVAGAYFNSRPQYDTWLRELENTPREAHQDLIRTFMSHHVSTQERLTILDNYYATIFADLPPIHSVMDVACGLNPLAIPWMPLAEGAVYYAYDLYEDMMAFLDRALPLLGVGGSATPADVSARVPSQSVDLALVIKAIPCLQHLDKYIGDKLLNGIDCRYIVVSFPAQSIGGREKGMVTHYTGMFEALLADHEWQVRRHVFATELVFVIEK